MVGERQNDDRADLTETYLWTQATQNKNWQQFPREEFQDIRSGSDHRHLIFVKLLYASAQRYTFRQLELYPVGSAELKSYELFLVIFVIQSSALQDTLGEKEPSGGCQSAQNQISCRSIGFDWDRSAVLISELGTHQSLPIH